MKCASKMTMGMMKMTQAKRASRACRPGVKTTGDLIDTLHELGSFKTLRSALDAADLTASLRAEGPFTLFAPTDEAFSKLPDGTLSALLKDVPKLKTILLRHVVTGLWKPEGWMHTISIQPLEGKPVQIAIDDGKVVVDEVPVTFTNISGANGVIHILDAVLLSS